MWQETVNEWLKRNERSQAWLARQAGITRRHLFGCMSGERRISVKTLIKLEQAMSAMPGILVLDQEAADAEQQSA